MYRFAAVLLALTILCGPTRADVIINEIFYHAPDDMDALQYIELHNTGDQAVDLGGWRLSKGVKYQFPAGTTIAPGGYLVVCKDLKLFRKYYGFDAAGPFDGKLSHNKDQLELLDAAGKKVDSMKYGSRAPWPLAPDGYGSSLERICPTAPGKNSENWAPSPLATGSPKPRGTPGKQNANDTPRLPPVIANVAFTPAHAAPDQEVRVEADVTGDGLQSVELLYRAAGPGYEKPETALAMTKGAAGRYGASIPAHKANQIVRFRIKAVDGQGTLRFFPSEHDVRPALSVCVHDPFKPGKTPLGLVIHVGEAEFRAAQKPGFAFGFGFGGPSASPPARGKAAFVYVNQKTGEPELFDFINVTPRKGGRRVRLHKDHLLDDMTTFVLIYEDMDRYALAESLSYAVYHKAGAAAPRTDFVRTWIDGRPVGFQLLIEQPNKAFLRRNGLRADGNLYKVQWFGQGLVGQHEKKTRIYEGHQDLIDVVGQLNKTRGEEQWLVIKKNFDVEQMINYFAVGMLLSNWDGYFNNHFVYHDVRGTGKWTMYPWDHDKTWGYHDGIRGYEVFTEMPLTFGMEGDVPRGPNTGFGGPVWWRPGGYFSKPLLANPHFRKLFLARTKELLEKVYTEEVVFPLIKDMGERLRDEVKIRAELRRENPQQALTHLDRNLDSLREHLTKRRKYLLDQPEIKTAGKFDRGELK
jgi:hypothetical protein